MFFVLHWACRYDFKFQTNIVIDYFINIIKVSAYYCYCIDYFIILIAIIQKLLDL